MSKSKKSDKTKISEDTPKTGDDSRRKAVTKIVATAGVAAAMSGNWKKPVADSVVLPSHARMTLKDGMPDSSDSPSDADGGDGIPLDGEMG